MLFSRIVRKTIAAYARLRPVRGKNNRIIGLNIYGFFGGGRIRIVGNNNIIECRSRHIGKVDITVYGDNHRLLIEPGVVFKRGSIWFEDSGNEIVIGGGSTLEDVQFAAAESGTRIRIGTDCMCSSCIRISTTDSHSVVDLASGRRLNPAQDIIIGNHVWIGTRTAVNKGVYIGDGAIVGSNTVVTHDVAPNTLVAGIPARMIKEQVTWDRKRL